MRSKKGFTIIEVVLVLAIAGLIFLMVFIALPALQRSQRDTQRRNDMARVATAITQYQSNNSGSLPFNTTTYAKYNANSTSHPSINDCGSTSVSNTKKACEFVRDYMNGSGATANSFKDPSGNYYSFWFTSIKSNGELSNSAWTSAAKSTKLTGNSADGYSLSGESPAVIVVVAGARCNGEKVEKAGDKAYAIMYQLEGAGVYCSDNS